VELLVELGLKGGYQSSERVIKGKLTWLLENNYLTHQLNLQVRSRRQLKPSANG